MSRIYSILEKIFDCNGENPNLWENLKIIIQNRSEEIDPFCFLMKNRINSGNKDEIILTLNILDFAVDSGRLLLWTKIDNNIFLLSLINILKTKKDNDLQNLALYLIEKWAIKFQNYPSIQNCKDIYNSLKKNNIIFPNDINNPYEKYLIKNNKINKNNINSNHMNSNYINKQNNNYSFNNIRNNININNSTINKYNFNHNIDINNSNINKNNLNNNYIFNQNNIFIRQSRLPTNPNEYVNNIKYDLNPNNYDKKYTKFVNKLYDCTLLIQEINILINNNFNCQNNSKLKMLCKDLKENNELLIKTIQGPKLKEEKLMLISLNINEDIIMTFNRYEKSLKGENPGPFLSSFTRDDNPYFNKYEKKTNNNMYDTFNNDCPKEEIGKLGFGDTISTKYMTEGGNKDINNSLQNNLSDYFENTTKTTKTNMVQTIDLNSKNKNSFYSNMSNSNSNSNSNINLSAAKVRYPDYSKFLNNQNNKNHLHYSQMMPIYETRITKNDNNNNYEKIADNYDIKILINNNAYKKNNNNYKQMYKSQIFPNMNFNINDRDNREAMYKSQFIVNKKNNI